MRMKRIAALTMAAFMALALTGCGAGGKKDEPQDGGMTIRPAQLSEEEAALVDLLGVEMGTHRLFDFQVEGAKSIRLRAYELVDGNWNCVVHGAAETSGGQGRIALTFGKMTDGVRMACTDPNGAFTREFAMEAGDTSAMTFATSKLGGAASIELDLEIPLALQIATTQSEFSTYDVDYFGMPRELAKHEYEHVYAITVTFSKQEPSALLQDGPSASPEAEPSPAA